MSNETIIRIGEIEFHVDGGDVATAGITSELLAARLGYSHRKRLEELADRHARYLAEFGQMLTVSIRVQAPGQVAAREVEMPVYNREQATYLIAKSEQPVANELTVAVVKAFIELQKRFSAPAISSSDVAMVISEVVAPMSACIDELRSEVAALKNRSGGVITDAELRTVRATVKRVALLYVAAHMAKSVGSARSRIYCELRKSIGFTGTFRLLASHLLGVVMSLLGEKESMAQQVITVEAEQRQQVLFSGN